MNTRIAQQPRPTRHMISFIYFQSYTQIRLTIIHKQWNGSNRIWFIGIFSIEKELFVSYIMLNSYHLIFFHQLGNIRIVQRCYQHKLCSSLNWLPYISYGIALFSRRAVTNRTRGWVSSRPSLVTHRSHLLDHITDSSPKRYTFFLGKPVNKP